MRLHEIRRRRQWHAARFAGKPAYAGATFLASGGILYTQQQRFHASLVVNYIDRRYLDQENTAQAPAYATLAATLGYRMGRYDLTLEGFNLTDERPPVSQSEFGDSSYYLLPARSAFLRLGAAL